MAGLSQPDYWSEIRTSAWPLTYQIQYVHQRPARVAIIALYALPQGVPVGAIELGGIGQPWNPAPIPGCFAVFLGSDSEGHFGHSCPYCEGYWRSQPWPMVCPYCAGRASGHEFLSVAQRRYVVEYCRQLRTALGSDTDGDVAIDMDAVADAVETEGEKPPFYVSERSQQQKFTCEACGEFNDILGRFGYCSTCGTRNDLAQFRDETVPALRERVNSGTPPEDCVRDAVGSFDTLIGQYARQLAERVPLTKRRSERLRKQRYHNVDEVRDVLATWFDVDLKAGISEGDWSFARRMFFRRHVYEHNGGEVDQKYLDDSQDTSVTLKQRIRETQEAAHRLLGLLARLARNLHDGFHEVLPVIEAPIRHFERKKARMSGPGGS